MLEQVNIQVQQTNENVTIVSSEIKEEININVYETKEEVKIHVTEEVIKISINKVTSEKITKTSELINDGQDGNHPFITLEDLPDLDYTPEDLANKSTSIPNDQASDLKYPTVKSVYNWAISVFTTPSAVSLQISAALSGYATQSWVSSQGYIRNVIGSLGYTPAKQVIQLTPITLNAASWALVSGLYEYVYSNVNILSTSVVNVIPSNSTIAIVQAASILPSTESSSGSVKLFATNLPSADIIVTFNIFN